MDRRNMFKAVGGFLVGFLGFGLSEPKKYPITLTINGVTKHTIYTTKSPEKFIADLKIQLANAKKKEPIWAKQGEWAMYNV